MLREGLPEDAEAIENIRIAAWQTAYRDFMPRTYLSNLNPLQNIEALRNRLSSQNLEFVVSVAEEEGIVVAFSILGKPRYEASCDTIELWALNVLPEYWRMGIGQRLTKRAITSAAESGFKKIELWCIKDNVPAQSAYADAGFLPTDAERSSSHLTGDPLHELHYPKKL